MKNQQSLWEVVKKAIPNKLISEDMDFHLVWNPLHEGYPKFAFKDIEDAKMLRNILAVRFAPDPFFVMSHWSGVEAEIVAL